jgi:hypothetical protein
MLEILLFGAALVAIYFMAHTVVMQVERWRGKALGAWRTGLFFSVFLLLTLGAFQLIPLLLGYGSAS